MATLTTRVAEFIAQMNDRTPPALVAVAEAREIPFQMEIMTRGGTDTREIQLSGGGALAGGVSIPTRYLHQVVECCHPGDLDAAVALVAGFCETAHDLLP